MKKIPVIISILITSGLFFLFYLYPNLLGGPSRDGLPGFSDFLRIGVLGLAVIGPIVFLAFKPRPIISIVVFAVGTFLLSSILMLCVDSPKLVYMQKITKRDHLNSETLLDGLVTLCAPNKIETLIFPERGLGGIPMREVEFVCGEKSGVYDIWGDQFYDHRVYSFDQCEHKLYNKFMRSIGSLKRKACIPQYVY